MQFVPRLNILSDKQIDAYTLQGVYGHKKREELISLIRRGKYRGLDHRINKGEFGLDVKRALLERPSKDRDKKLQALDAFIADFLAELDTPNNAGHLNS